MDIVQEICDEIMGAAGDEEIATNSYKENGAVSYLLTNLFR